MSKKLDTSNLKPFDPKSAKVGDVFIHNNSFKYKLVHIIDDKAVKLKYLFYTCSQDNKNGYAAFLKEKECIEHLFAENKKITKWGYVKYYDGEYFTASTILHDSKDEAEKYKLMEYKTYNNNNFILAKVEFF